MLPTSADIVSEGMWVLNLCLISSVLQLPTPTGALPADGAVTAHSPTLAVLQTFSKIVSLIL